MTDDLLKVHEVKGCGGGGYENMQDEVIGQHGLALSFAPNCPACLLLVQKFYGERAYWAGVSFDSVVDALTAIRRAFGVTE